ncbi:hypothetical protein C162_30385 [Paenibacillus sp. FSL R7-269]|uniref:hypothetical protein n=1 Tax=Paenibacillus sp. FSL R7-269 TaxID=1226755 RepID=UPI0003E217CE|nr:hypothetical protein [Paenibacillus sp. FSL R7-269]ETT33942.1 hypothetical protein C162_30385 [Paenibacillus sp. FSL R7-269]
MIKKLELSIDLTRPTEEITEATITIMEFFPGRQLGILQQVDQNIGDILAAMQPKEDQGPVETAKESTKEST